MNEIEVKILNIDKEIIVSKLNELWAKKIAEGQIESKFYINDQKKKLRVRKINNEIILTYKQKILNDKMISNIEHETSIGNELELVHILLGLNFEQYGFSSKYRITYHLWNISYELDKYDNIPWLLEVEVRNEKDLNEALHKLGFALDDTCNLTERQVKEYYWIDK